MVIQPLVSQNKVPTIIRKKRGRPRLGSLKDRQSEITDNWKIQISDRENLNHPNKHNPKTNALIGLFNLYLLISCIKWWFNQHNTSKNPIMER